MVNVRIKGKSTGVRQWSADLKRKAQERELQRQKEVIHNDFSSIVQKGPTPEQIERKKKREEKEARLAARRYERGHRGGTYGTNAQKKKEQKSNG